MDTSSVALRAPLEVLMEALPDGVLIADPQGRIAFVNGRLEELSGYRREELLRRPVEFLVPDRLELMHERHRFAYHEGPRLRPMGTGLDIRLLRKDGAEVPVDIQLSPLELGPEVVTVAAVRDIAERSEAEEAIRESEERLVLAGDRERIARLLTDSVIGSLFGVGLALQGLSSRMKDEGARRRIEELVAEVDRIIAELRDHVFGLRG